MTHINRSPEFPARFNVAMTRARHTLTLARLAQIHTLHTLEACPSVFHRDLIDLPPVVPQLRRLYRQLSLREIDLGFAGRFHGSHRAHKYIAALSPGDPLKVRITQIDRWELLNREGRLVGRLAKGFNPPDDMRCLSAKVIAVVVRTRELSEPQYQESIKCDEWEIVVPEVVFGPQ